MSKVSYVECKKTKRSLNPTKNGTATTELQLIIYSGRLNAASSSNFSGYLRDPYKNVKYPNLNAGPGPCQWARFRTQAIVVFDE